MEPAEAKRKKARQRRGGAEPDRLSALPDCLLHTIMSSLEARQAVQTCVLSTRWRHLWRSVPCLDIDLDEFKGAPNTNGNAGLLCDDSDSYYESSEEEEDDNHHGIAFKNKEWERFEDFSMNLMLGCNIAQLESFRLHIESSRAPSFGDRQAAGWIRWAMCTPDRAPHRQGLSSCSWLLKRLHLGHVRLDDRFMKHVNSVCHSLEDMKLEDCRCEIQSITSDSLKTLILKTCRWRNLCEIASPTLKTLVIDGGYNAFMCLLVILAPAVSYRHLDGNFCAGLSLNEMPSLAKALFRLQRYSNRDEFKLLCSVSNVTSLELLDVGTTVLGKKPTFQEFKNLRNLVLGNCDLRDDFRTLGFFLQSSPNLEKLTLRHCQFPRYYAQKKGTPQLNQASSSEFRGLDFMCENLKVEIIYRSGNARLASQPVNLLLRAAGNLSKPNIKLTNVEYSLRPKRNSFRSWARELRRSEKVEVHKKTRMNK